MEEVGKSVECRILDAIFDRSTAATGKVLDISEKADEVGRSTVKSPWFWGGAFTGGLFTSND